MTTPSREWNSSAYHRLSAPQVSWGKKVLARLNLRGDEVILDAGCGTGRLTADLLQALPRGRVLAVDLSQNMLAEARAHLQPQFGERVSFLAADLQDLPFADFFHGIVSTAVFHWVLDHDRLFQSLHRALRPAGWLCAQCGGGSNLQRLRQRADALSATPRFAQFFTGFREPWLYTDAETTARKLRAAGFVNVETGIEPALTVLEDAPQYAEFIKAIIFRQHLERIPAAPLRDQYVAELTRQAANDTPPYSLDYVRLNLSGERPQP